MDQNQSERCSNLEIDTEKWTVPKINLAEISYMTDDYRMS